MMTSSSTNEAVTKMANKTTPTLPNYSKKSTINEADHSAGWLDGGLESIVPTVEYPIVDGTTMVCFESHLVAGLGLAPSKFLVSINFLGCEHVHMNLNTIIVLICFTMLCECWLVFPADTSLF
jgi:hypothetical protein